MLILPGYARGDECLGWFLRAGLAKETSDCELKCSVTPVDMGTFSCPQQCEDLCQKDTFDLVLKYTPRLTEGDRVVIKKYPLDALTVYRLKSEVDSLTDKVFGKASTGDESDAFRHFVWSARLSIELGKEKAKLFLDAHEQDSTQSSLDKKMDIENNSQGMKFIDAQVGVKPEIDAIEKEALQRLRSKSLIVNEPKLKNIPGGYYSK